MKHALGKLILVLACSAFFQTGPAFAQDEVASWVPTLWGNTWIYQHEAKAERWRTEETITKVIPVLEGTIVVRRIRVIKGKPSVAPPKEQAWLLHGDGLYDLDPGDWDARRPGQLSAAFSATPPWNGGEHFRVFCFPLSDGKTWGKESGRGKAPVPVAEVGLDYAKNSLAISTSGSSSQNGGSIYGQYFLKGTAQKWSFRSMFSVVANFSGSGSNRGSLYTYMFGPRLNIELRKAHVFYYFEPMIGASHVQVNGTNLAGSAAAAARSSFAYGASYGFGFLAGEHCVVTLFRIETVSQEVPDVASGTSRWRGDSRLSGGIGFRFGQR